MVDDDFEMEIIMHSRKNDCHTAHALYSIDVATNRVPVIIDFMTKRLKRFIPARY